jgi:hypothetical protein
MLRLNAARASASGNTESIAGRRSPPSTSRVSSRSYPRFGSTTKYTAPIPAPPRDLRRIGGHGHHPATPSHHGRRAFEQLAAHGVEDEIDGVECLLESGGLVIDHLVRPESADGLDLRGRCGADHVGATPPRELRREVADAARGPVDQHPLSL